MDARLNKDGLSHLCYTWDKEAIRALLFLLHSRLVGNPSWSFNIASHRSFSKIPHSIEFLYFILELHACHLEARQPI